MKIFINDELKATNEYNGAIFSAFNSYLGSGNSDANSGFNGSIKSFELVGSSNYLISAGTGNILYDHSGNQNHGTINEALG